MHLFHVKCLACALVGLLLSVQWQRGRGVGWGVEDGPSLTIQKCFRQTANISDSHHH